MSYERMDGKAIGTKYRGAIALFQRQLASGNLRLSFEQEADAYFRRCALTIWARENRITENHVSAYNAITSGSNRPPKMLYLELCAAVTDAPSFSPPGFFSQLIAADQGTGRDRTGQFCSLCEMLFALFASASDSVNDRTIAYMKDCVNRLRHEAGKPASPASAKQENGQAVSSAAEKAAEADPQESPQEEAPQPTLEELMAELDSLCGLERVKKEVRSLVNLVKIRKLRQEQELPTPAMSLHLVFMGNPGTGKTTVARLLAGIYRAIGVLPKGQLVEVDRSGLVAGYVGQTAIQTQKVIQSALGGILFIDEAYSLASQPGTNDFGQEAIDTILKAMEDHRDELVVIVAGYNELMMKFIHSNPGLESRFNKYIYFDDYDGKELEQIFLSTCKKNGYEAEDELKEVLGDYFNDLYETRDENFGNARDVRNIFEKLVTIQSDRVAAMETPTREDLIKLTLADFRQFQREESGEEEEEEAEAKKQE